MLEALAGSDFIKRERLVYEAGIDPAPDPQPGVAAAATNVLKEEDAVYLTQLYYSEIGVTNRVRQLIDHPTSRLRSLQEVGADEIRRRPGPGHGSGGAAGRGDSHGRDQ